MSKKNGAEVLEEIKQMTMANDYSMKHLTDSGEQLSEMEESFRDTILVAVMFLGFIEENPRIKKKLIKKLNEI